MKTRKETNAYAREYYKNHKAKHIAMVVAWKKANPDKVKAYANSEKAEQRRLTSKRYSEKNKEKLKAYHKEWSAKRKLKEGKN